MEKSVLILTNSDSGLYDFRKEVLTALQKEGYRVHVSVPDTGYAKKIDALGCIRHETHLDRRGMNPLQDGKLFLFYLRLIRQVRPAAVLTYTIKPNVYGGMACRLLRVPVLANITGLGSTLQKSGILQKLIVFLYREGLRCASCVFFQNKKNLEFMTEKGCLKRGAPVRVIPGSGVNLQEHEYRPYPGDKQVRFLSVMRIMKDKGIGELLETAGTIHAQYPETLFEILGAYEEESRDRYEPLIGDLQSRGAVRYYGYRDDVAAFYEDCHALIHPSYHEGMSNVLQEAAAAGRPVLASDINGCKEIFEDGISGFAFPPKDAAGLTEAVRRFLSLSHSQREEMGRQARAYVEGHFDRRDVVEAYLEEIRRVTGR